MQSAVKKRRLAALERLGASDTASEQKRENSGKVGGATPKLRVAQVGGQGGNQRPLGLAKGAVINLERSSSRSTDYRGKDETAGKEPPAAIYQPLELKHARKPSIPIDLLEDLLSTSSRNVNSREAVKGKVQDQMILLDNPTAGLRGAARKRRWQPDATPALLTAAQCRQRQLLVGPNSRVSPAAVVALQEQWSKYIGRLFLSSARSVEEALLVASWCGCRIEVKKSNNPAHVGCHGTVVSETARSFTVAQEDGSLRAIPKWSVTFEVPLPDGRRVRLFGSELMGAKKAA